MTICCVGLQIDFPATADFNNFVLICVINKNTYVASMREGR